MNSLARNAATFLLTGAMAFALVGCGQGQSAGSQDSTAGAESIAASAASASIDVTSLGSAVTTYAGAKYIVSDATVDQGASDGEKVDYGLQEVCVVHQPAAWGTDGTIGWSRNNISFTYMPTEWGSIMYGYSYRNEAGASQEALGPGCASEEVYFNGMGEVQHTVLGDHKISYVFDQEEGAAGGIPDLEAQAAEAGSDDGERTVAVYTFEQRADKCAFNVSVVCTIDAGAVFELTAEQLIAQAYEPLEFVAYGQGVEVDAASYRANPTIADAANERTLVVAQKNGNLLSYGAHEVALVDPIEGQLAKNPVRYDFAPTDEPAQDAETHEVEGLAVKVSIEEQGFGTAEDAPVERILHAWVDMDGKPLRIEAILSQDEDVDATLARLVGDGRLTLQ